MFAFHVNWSRSLAPSVNETENIIKFPLLTLCFMKRNAFCLINPSVMNTYCSNHELYLIKTRNVHNCLPGVLSQILELPAAR